MTFTAREPGVYPLFSDTITDWALHEDEIDWEVEPFVMGNAWRKADPDWDGPVDPNGYVLPKLTLGWQAIQWGSENLLSDETDEHDKKKPFKLTPEQARVVLWLYEVDENGKLVSNEFTLQRLKGH